MATHELKLPRLGETMETGVLVAWHKHSGDSFKRGEILADVETDKTVVELPALSDGEMLETIAAPGQTVAVGEPLARYASDAAPATVAESPAPSTAKQPATARNSDRKRLQAGASGKRHVASPRARRLGWELGVNAASLQGSGRGGRVIGADVQAAGNAKLPLARSNTIASRPMPLMHWPAPRRTTRPPIVLIHGLFGNASSWKPIVAGLARSGEDVYAVDLPGHGSNQAADTDAAAGHLAEVLLAHVAPPLRLVGMSWGAIIAAQAAARLAHDCSELNLIAPAGLNDEVNKDFFDGMLNAESIDDLEAPLRLMGPAASRLSPEVRTAMIRDLAGRRDNLRNIVAQAFPGGKPSMGLSSLLESTAFPVRALFALADEIHPWELAAKLPAHAASSFLPNAGHMLIWDDPDAVVAWLRHHHK